MLVEGIYLYLFVVKVYNIVDKMRLYQAISWVRTISNIFCFISSF